MMKSSVVARSSAASRFSSLARARSARPLESCRESMEATCHERIFRCADSLPQVVSIALTLPVAKSMAVRAGIQLTSADIDLAREIAHGHGAAVQDDGSDDWRARGIRAVRG